MCHLIICCLHTQNQLVLPHSTKLCGTHKQHGALQGASVMSARSYQRLRFSVQETMHKLMLRHGHLHNNCVTGYFGQECASATDNET